jgi:hypothetical protein
LSEEDGLIEVVRDEAASWDPIVRASVINGLGEIVNGSSADDLVDHLVEGR